MATTKLSKANYVTRGYSQLEPNHLAAQRTGQIYAQTPAASAIEVLENGEFAKLDYATNQVNFTGSGEWLLVYNEVKTYRDYESACDFALRKADYAAKLYGMNYVYPTKKTQEDHETEDAPVRDYTGIAHADPYEVDSTSNPFATTGYLADKAFDSGVSAMIPRLYKTFVGDVITTNAINCAVVSEAITLPAVGDTLVPAVTTDGKGCFLAKKANPQTGDMVWRVVKVYTLADRQPAVKLVRTA